MPKSPSVNFVIENNNVDKTTPLLGVSAILARTTKGAFNDPSKLITSPSQFQKLFGKEIVPDGSPSNIEKALIGGSKLRIIRVPGNGYYKGILHPSNTSVPSSTSTQRPSAVITIGSSASKVVTIGFFTKVYDQPIDGTDTFAVTWGRSKNTINYQITGYNGTSANSVVLESNAVITYKNHDSLNTTSVDYLQFNNFLHNSEFLEPVVVSSNIEGVNSVDTLVKYLADTVDGSNTTDLYFDINGTKDLMNTTTVPAVLYTYEEYKALAGKGSTTQEQFNALSTAEKTKTPATTEVTIVPVTSIAIKGSSGTIPTKDQWIESMDSLRDMLEPYQVICSHLDQHLESSSDQLLVHKAAKELADEVEEFVYYIEVPKYTTHYSQGTQIRKDSDINSWINTCLNTIGNSKFVAYFAGGIMYYNEQGINIASDVLGTILGLGDASASNFGPWRSFAGMNRGVIWDGNGPASPNYGAPSRYAALNELASNYANMIVVKDTRSSGKQTMLWHCFTSQVKQDSFKFLAIVRLVLYLKKYLRPILESYIEEPNIWNTWKDMYLEVKPMLDDLVDQDAISEYTWNGDQDATSYEQLVVNNEADVRQGRYKIVLTFKEVVPMQDITMVLSIDKASNTSSVSISND